MTEKQGLDHLATATATATASGDLVLMTPEGSETGKRGFRNTLGHYATGVTVITARDKTGADIGLTVNSFSSVSLHPPLILWSLGRDSQSLDVFTDGAHFTVNVLGTQQEAVARHFAVSARDQFDNAPAEVQPLVRGLGDVPLIGGCIAYFECRVEKLLEGGDHTIVLGRVERFADPGGSPLLFHCGKFTTRV